MSIFNNVSLLITHYNRSSSLERLLLRFQELEFEFHEIIVSDDGSKPEHLKRLVEMQPIYNYILVTTPANKGLGNNINKGQDKVTAKYTLYVQEDFVPKELFKKEFAASLEMMEKNDKIDMARYYAYFKYPFLKPYQANFSEMMFSASPWYTGYRKFYYYSDHPHLRRTSFFEKFGRYAEGIHVEKTEYRMMMSFIQHKGKALMYTDVNGLFSQENSSEEPSTVSRNYWRNAKNPFVIVLKHSYRYIKFHLDFYLQKKSV